WWLAGSAAGTLLWLIPTLWTSGFGPTWEVMVRLAARQPLAFSYVREGLFPFVTVLAALGLWMGLRFCPPSWRPTLVFVVTAGCGVSIFLVAFTQVLVRMADVGLAAIAYEIIYEMISLLVMSVILVGVWIRKVRPEVRIAASAVGFQAVFQVFHIYPVAVGTQVIYSAPLIVLLAAACTYAFLDRYGLAKKAPSAAQRGPAGSPADSEIQGQRGVEGEPEADREVQWAPLASKYLGCRSVGDLVFSLAAVALVPFLAVGLIPLVKDYNRALPISAPTARGIRFLRVDAPQVEAAIQYVRKNTAPGEPLFTMPGMSSFYIWTERPGVTTYNAAPWTLLTPEMQQSIAASLSRVRFVVVNRKSLFWKVIVEVPKSASNRSTVLRDRIFQDYVPLPTQEWLKEKIPKRDRFLEIWVRRRPG
ncbi:MAG: hypothetical protein V3T44_06295, partial [bacterium]